MTHQSMAMPEMEERTKSQQKVDNFLSQVQSKGEVNDDDNEESQDEDNHGRDNEDEGEDLELEEVEHEARLTPNSGNRISIKKLVIDKRNIETENNDETQEQKEEAENGNETNTEPDDNSTNRI